MATKLYVSGARGESFADVARRIGTVSGVDIPSDATDAEVLGLVTGSVAIDLTQSQELAGIPWLDAGVLTGALSAGAGWTANRNAVARAIKAIYIDNADPDDRYYIATFTNAASGDDSYNIFRESTGSFCCSFGPAPLAKSTDGLTEIVLESIVDGLETSARMYVDFRDLDGLTGTLHNSATPGPLWVRRTSEGMALDARIVALKASIETPPGSAFVDDDGGISLITENVEWNSDAEPVKVASAEGDVSGLVQGGSIIRWADTGGTTPLLRQFDTDGLRNLPDTVAKILFVPALGQSLLTGTGGYPIVTTAPTHAGRSWMFNGGSRTTQGDAFANLDRKRLDDRQILSLVELYESLPRPPFDAIDYGETQGGGISYWMGASGVMPADTVLLWGTFAFGGTSIAENDPSSLAYGNVIRALERINALCRINGIALEVPALVWDQGEADVFYGTSPATYKAALTTLQSAITTDVQALIGGSAQVPLLIRQSSSFTKYGAAIDPLMYAIVDHALANPTKFKLAGPQYPNPGYGADGVHMGPGGYRLEGEYIGRALAGVRASGNAGGLVCTAVSNVGTAITATFSATVALDTTNVTDPGQKGLVLLAPDGTTTIGLSSIADHGNATITATAGSTPTPGQAYTLEIAGRGTLNAAAGPTTGARSCIRDSSNDNTSAAVQTALTAPATALGLTAPTKLRNWAHHQRKTFVAA